MIHLLLPAIVLLLSVGVSAQTVRAVTDDGRAILVHADGTWEPVPDEIELDLTEAVPPPPAPPALPPSAPPRTVEGASGTYRIEYDASRWRAGGSRLNPDSEFEFTLPQGAGYAIVIYEVIPYPEDTMREIILANAEQGTGATPVLVKDRTISVGGGEMRQLEYRVEAGPGMDVTFINSFHSDERGTLQIVTWTASSVMDRFRDELLRFSKGVTLLDPTQP